MLPVDKFFEVLKDRASFPFPAEAGPYDLVDVDLAFDSLQLFELLVITETMAEVLIPSEELPAIERLIDLYDYYGTCVSASTIPPGVDG